VQRLIAYFGKNTPWNAAPRTTPRGPAPAGDVFLLGFVRSGTTLLEVVMASHAKVVASDEHDFLADAARAFLDSDEDLDRLAEAGGAELEPWRENYWRAVHDLGFEVEGRVFVDKVPLNSLRLPLIAKLFPSAKIILALRDPRDVVLSTFFHRFDMNPASFEFLRIDDCARFYSATMRLVDLHREMLGLDLYEHYYEEIAGDFERAVRGICAFVGIEWMESMRDFSAAAGDIDRRSQSGQQVRRGLYAGASGKWRRYRDQMAAILPILNPWVQRFDYPVD
jgi:hypothetical protein